jgi:Flp pilus assembly secretin CpaC
MSRVSTRVNPRLVVRLTVAGLAMAWLLGTIPALAEPISVMVDRAKVMRISRPADIVIIGNPAIADATIQDNQTLIITGRSFGTTNLIVLDANGEAIADEIVTVAASDDKVVTVFRRSLRQTYSCTPTCSPTLVIGDTPAIFESVNEQIQAHGTLSDQAANR